MSDIAKNDMYIYNLNGLIDNRKKLLIDKFKEINKNIYKNERLQDVFIDNYEEFDKIILEKIKLINAFTYVTAYLDTIIEDTNIPKDKREEAYREKKDIINIINSEKQKIKLLRQT